VTGKRTISAVHETDLEEFFESLGILSQILAGEMKCIICTDQISLGNIAKVIIGNEVQLVCDKSTCHFDEEAE
jgi:hypothetical protein